MLDQWAVMLAPWAVTIAPWAVMLAPWHGMLDQRAVMIHTHVFHVVQCLGATVRSCILDCEAVAYDVDKKQIMPFQVRPFSMFQAGPKCVELRHH